MELTTGWFKTPADLSLLLNIGAGETPVPLLSDACSVLLWICPSLGREAGEQCWFTGAQFTCHSQVLFIL